MEQLFVETIKIQDGEPQHLNYHQARMEKTIRRFFPALYGSPTMPLSLERLLLANDETERPILSVTEPGTVKARVVYGGHGVESIEYTPYVMREIKSLRVVANDSIDYPYKSCDRSQLTQLAALKGNCDEVIIMKHGLLTDTSFTNLAIYDGKEWLTPRQPLLAGTKREYLLDQGIIKEADITLTDLRAARRVSLFNAMIEFEEMEVDASMLIYEG